MENRKRTVDVEELRRLGVPEAFIETAEYYSQRGAFDDEPSPELLENTIAQCLAELRERRETELPSVPDVVMTNQAAYAQARDSFVEIKSLGDLPAVYANSVWYALANPEPPLLMVENHNRLDPSWWRCDELSNVRAACGKINSFAKTLQRPVSSRVVVLRKDPSQYGREELEEISMLHREATSDVYWISAERAGKFAAVDELVVGDQCVLRMTGAPSSPTQAVEFLLSSKIEDPAEALRERAHIGGLINRCVPVKVGGHVRPEFKCLLSGADGAREAIRMVISENV